MLTLMICLCITWDVLIILQYSAVPAPIREGQINDIVSIMLSLVSILLLAIVKFQTRFSDSIRFILIK